MVNDIDKADWLWANSLTITIDLRADPGMHCRQAEVSHMTRKQLHSPAQTRTSDIVAAADLLHRMMSELHSLRAATTSPGLAMAIDARELREQLHELFATVRALTREAEPRHAEELTYRALDLIKRLAEELECLVCEAERDSGRVPPGCDCVGMAN
jgi:hypothetical protein